MSAINETLDFRPPPYGRGSGSDLRHAQVLDGFPQSPYETSLSGQTNAMAMHAARQLISLSAAIGPLRCQGSAPHQFRRAPVDRIGDVRLAGSEMGSPRRELALAAPAAAGKAAAGSRCSAIAIRHSRNTCRDRQYQDCCRRL